MATNTLVLSGFRVTDPSSNIYDFQILKASQGAVGWTLETRPWEPGDPAQRWRIALHPWIGGLNEDRLYPSPRTYAKANADATYPNMLLFPPLINNATGANLNAPVKLVVFDSKIFAIGGRYVYMFDPSTNTLSEDEDLGSGVSAVDATVFNNELVVACGESTKIFTRATSGTYTQASDNTFAIALGVVGSQLWRAEETNEISFCNSSPRTLANWSPADGSEYTAGDETFAVHTIIDYGGIPWVLKGDGAYAPDPQSRFKNQTPQIKRTPNVDNGKGSFVAQGALWIPAVDGLYRIKPGKSHKRGPEVTFRPSYRFRVRGGVEYGEFIYLLVTDSGGVGQTFICKMSAEAYNEDLGHEYIYQEWARLGSTDLGYAIGVTTAGTSPKLCFTTGTDDFNWIDLGRGGGRDADDGLYRYGTAMSLETGLMQVASDVTVESTLVGVDVALDYSRVNESLTLAYRWDATCGCPDTTYTNLLDEAESGGGSAAITLTSLYDRVTRYANANNSGHHLEVRFTGSAAYGGSANAAVTTTDTTLTDTRLSLTTNAAVGLVVTCDGKTMTVTSNTSDTFTGSAWSGGGNPGNGDAWSLNAGGFGVKRPVIKEAWAHGYTHPVQTDIISLAVVGDDTIAPGRAETLRLFRYWQSEGSELLCELEGYERSRNTRFLVGKVEEESISGSPGNHKEQTRYDTMIRVQLVRVDRAGGYAT